MITSHDSTVSDLEEKINCLSTSVLNIKKEYEFKIKQIYTHKTELEVLINSKSHEYNKEVCDLKDQIIKLKNIEESEIIKIKNDYNIQFTSLNDKLYENEVLIDALKNEGNLKINELNKDYSVLQCQKNMLSNEINLQKTNLLNANSKIMEHISQIENELTQKNELKQDIFIIKQTCTSLKELKSTLEKDNEHLNNLNIDLKLLNSKLEAELNNVTNINNNLQKIIDEKTFDEKNYKIEITKLKNEIFENKRSIFDLNNSAEKIHHELNNKLTETEDH
jgi:chromosome segregation ATPase